jgi:2-haloacid dehalogenase
VDAVVFDVGGVLLDWSPSHLYEQLIPDPVEREHFLTVIATPAWNLRQDAGRPWAEAIAELTALHPEYDEWIAAYDTGWLRMCRGIFAATAELHGDLRSAGIPTYALTNFSAPKWFVATEAFPELTNFDGAVISGLEQTTKPDERIYRILLQRYHLDPARTFFTDDVQRNVDAARSVGIIAELFTSADELRIQLETHGLLVDRPSAGRTTVG